MVLTYKKSLIVGIAFCVGVGFQNGLIFPEITRDFAGGILDNGMTAVGLTAIILSLFVEFTIPRRHRLSVPFDTEFTARDPELPGQLCFQISMGAKQ